MAYVANLGPRNTRPLFDFLRQRALSEMPGLLEHAGDFLRACEGATSDMTASSNILPRANLRGLLLLSAFCLFGGGAAQAQNIDEGKSAQQLYAATCAACHKNPSTLAKGRFRATLVPFLQDHYTTSMGEAWALAGYLTSVDAGPPRSKKPGTTKKRPAAAPSAQ
jgi:hypothetical protein